jgi:hypothetical protein
MIGRITEVRRKMLRNIHEGRNPYDGFTGSQLGGAIRSMHLFRGVWNLVAWDPNNERWKLTDAGIRELKPKCTCTGPSHHHGCPHWVLPL